ncbi:MAG TPA: Rrf2 family transcriptional regulator [Tepidisphaeraceae bacterium]|nr:Rrf2 family transcriptional regulator [Tepidisphaeraceae bacterium]
MLRLSKKADYALISLGYLAEHPNQVVSAREMAQRCHLPLPLLMNILKVLHQRGILRSVRGASGGYQIAAELGRLSLHELSNLLDCGDGERAGTAGAGENPLAEKRLARHGPAQALQYRLVRFMQDVSVADLVMPGRRIDVPRERVGVNKHRAVAAAGTGAAAANESEIQGSEIQGSEIPGPRQQGELSVAVNNR